MAASMVVRMVGKKVALWAEYLVVKSVVHLVEQSVALMVMKSVATKVVHSVASTAAQTVDSLVEYSAVMWEQKLVVKMAEQTVAC